MNEARGTITRMFRRAAEAKLNGASEEEAFAEVESIANNEAESLLVTAQVPTIFWGLLVWLNMLTHMREKDTDTMPTPTLSPSTLLFLFVQLNVHLILKTAEIRGYDKAKTKALISAHDPFVPKNRPQYLDKQMFN